MKILDYAVYTNRGKIRKDNEDSYLLKKEPYPLIAVADGMGGHSAGEIASQLAVDYLNQHKFNFENNILKEIDQVIKLVNEYIVMEGLKNEDYKGMGTTLSMGVIYQQNLYFGHVGDSRIYLFRNNVLKQLTTDHSLVNQLLEKKQITCSEAFNHPQKHIITQALGLETVLNVETKKINIETGDLLLFCTDGLSDMIKFKEFEELINNYYNVNNEIDVNKLSYILGEKAMEKGGSDNITLVIAFIN